LTDGNNNNNNNNNNNIQTFIYCHLQENKNSSGLQIDYDSIYNEINGLETHHCDELT